MQVNCSAFGASSFNGEFVLETESIDDCFVIELNRLDIGFLPKKKYYY